MFEVQKHCSPSVHAWGGGEGRWRIRKKMFEVQKTPLS